MKTYKDLDKSIVMNAPKKAMWYTTCMQLFFRYHNGVMEKFDWRGWVDAVAWDKFSEVQSNRNTFIPLPNIDIPWEATENSECPVADGTHIIAKEACGYTHQIKANSNNLYWNTKPITGNQIVSYKIIDEEYLPKQDNTKEVEAPKVHTFTWQQPVTITLPDNPNLELIKHLEFLQILANKFPEIKDKVVELMEVELDAWYIEGVEQEGE